MNHNCELTMTNILHCVSSFVRDNPESTIGLIGLLLTALGVIIPLNIASRNRVNRFHDNLEKGSLYQIDENFKNIERVLGKTIQGDDSLTLNDILDHSTPPEDINGSCKVFESLSPYFAEYCANLEKYNSNIMPRKQICFTFQEHSNKARAILDMFKKCNYTDVSLGLAELHLKSADIIANS